MFQSTLREPCNSYKRIAICMYTTTFFMSSVPSVFLRSTQHTAISYILAVKVQLLAPRQEVVWKPGRTLSSRRAKPSKSPPCLRPFSAEKKPRIELRTAIGRLRRATYIEFNIDIRWTRVGDEEEEQEEEGERCNHVPWDVTGGIRQLSESGVL